MKGEQLDALWPNGGRWDGWIIERVGTVTTQAELPGWRAKPPKRIIPPEGKKYLMIALSGVGHLGNTMASIPVPIPSTTGIVWDYAFGTLDTKAKLQAFRWLHTLETLLHHIERAEEATATGVEVVHRRRR